MEVVRLLKKLQAATRVYRAVDKDLTDKYKESYYDKVLNPQINVAFDALVSAVFAVVSRGEFEYDAWYKRLQDYPRDGKRTGWTDSGFIPDQFTSCVIYDSEMPFDMWEAKLTGLVAEANRQESLLRQETHKSKKGKCCGKCKCKSVS